jgi:hypothetical protein
MSEDVSATNNLLSTLKPSFWEFSRTKRPKQMILLNVSGEPLTRERDNTEM